MKENYQTFPVVLQKILLHLNLDEDVCVKTILWYIETFAANLQSCTGNFGTNFSHR